MSKRISIYCSSSNILEEKYIEAAREFARAVSLLNYTVVCGGSIRGLMGVIIDTMLISGNDSKVEGVMPQFMEDMEIHHPRLKYLTIVDSMSKRKELLRENTDATIVFPGGLGTLDEFLETYTLKRLGRYDGTVILFNQDGFYNSLLTMLDTFVQEKVLNSNYKDSLVVVDSVEELIEAVKNCKRSFFNAAHYLPV